MNWNNQKPPIYLLPSIKGQRKPADFDLNSKSSDIWLPEHEFGGIYRIPEKEDLTLGHLIILVGLNYAFNGGNESPGIHITPYSGGGAV